MNRLIGITFAVCCLASASASAQTLGVGDPAPELHIETWVKGDAVDLSTGKGKNVYVIEFWATWCPPCVMAIPHLTEIQKKYKDKNVVMVSVTDEPKQVVTKFMRQQGDKMGYTVAIDKQQKTTQAYMNASGQMGIPTSFIVDRQGKIAWIGSPYSMDRVLEEVVAGRFDIDKAKAEAKAEEKFFSTQYTELLLAMQSANWDKCVTIGRMVADPNTKISEALKSQILHSLAWAMLDHERADRKYFKEALHLAKAAFEVCGCEEASIIDTYARALFDNGQPREAVKYQQKAVELATDIMMRAELQNALKRYQAAAGAGS